MASIGELFVNLGITGADKTVSALGGVKKGMGELTSMSLEAKAGIVAALYAFERMMSLSGQVGTGLTNFNALTGISAQTLQQWQFAARQAGVSSEELSGSMKSVQNAMTNMLLNKGAPEGLQVVAKAVGGIDINRVRDVTYMMGKLQEAAQKLPKDVGNNMLKSFGLSEGVIAGMRRNVFNAQNFKNAPTYSDREVGQLDKANIAWGNLGTKIEMAFGHFNAKHGASLVQDISKIADAVFRLVDSLQALADKLKVFAILDQSFEGINKILGLLNGKDVNEVMKGDDKKRHFGDNTWWMNAINAAEDAALSATTTAPNSIAARQMVHAPVTTNQNISIVHHGDAKDTKAVRDVHKAAIGHAYRQRSAQGQGS